MDKQSVIRTPVVCFLLFFLAGASHGASINDPESLVQETPSRNESLEMGEGLYGVQPALEETSAALLKGIRKVEQETPKEPVTESQEKGGPTKLPEPVTLVLIGAGLAALAPRRENSI